MSRTLMTALAMVLVLAGACGDGGTEKKAEAVSDAEVQEVWDAVVKSHGEAETDEEKLAVVRGFLDEYPETSHTAYALDDVIYYMGQKLNDIEGAIEYITDLRGRIADPRLALDVDLKLLGAYEQAGWKDKFVELADRLAQAEGMKYTDHLRVLRSAVELKAWQVVVEHCQTAEKYATKEAFKAQYSDEEFDEAYLEEASKNRKGLLLGYDGWAKFNLGQVETALTEFADAEGLVRRHYFGHPDSDLYRYWGAVALEQGDYDTAIEKLSPIAIMAGDEGALTDLLKAYVGKNGRDTGFEDFSMQQRRKLAKTVDDFTLPDYEGNEHAFSDLRGEVTILSFWFPT